MWVNNTGVIVSWTNLDGDTVGWAGFNNPWTTLDNTQTTIWSNVNDDQ